MRRYVLMLAGAGIAVGSVVYLLTDPRASEWWFIGPPLGTSLWLLAFIRD